MRSFSMEILQTFRKVKGGKETIFLAHLHFWMGKPKTMIHIWDWGGLFDGKRSGFDRVRFLNTRFHGRGVTIRAAISWGFHGFNWNLYIRDIEFGQGIEVFCPERWRSHRLEESLMGLGGERHHWITPLPWDKRRSILRRSRLACLENFFKESRKIPMESTERVRVVPWRGLCLWISTKALTTRASSVEPKARQSK